MTSTTIILVIIVIVANATQDEIRFHWSRLFGHWFKPGSKLEKWFNPAISWQNKYYNSRWLTFIFSTLLVWMTDFWHLLKFIIINSIVIAFFLLLGGSQFISDWILVIVGSNVVWGTLYETIMGIYGALSDKYIKK